MCSLAEDTSAGLVHCCCFTSHHEYAEAAVIEDSGGKSSEMIEANPNIKANLHFSDSETLITAQVPRPLTLERAGEESPGELL